MSAAALSFFDKANEKEEPTQANSEFDVDPLAQTAHRGDGRQEMLMATEQKPPTKKRTFAEANFPRGNRPVTVNLQELAGKVRSKREIYKLLTEQCKSLY
jgi:hypothetical protein